MNDTSSHKNELQFVFIQFSFKLIAVSFSLTILQYIMITQGISIIEELYVSMICRMLSGVKELYVFNFTNEKFTVRDGIEMTHITKVLLRND